MIRLSSIRPGLFANTANDGPAVKSAFPCSLGSCTYSFSSGVSLNSLGEAGCQEQFQFAWVQRCGTSSARGGFFLF